MSNIVKTGPTYIFVSEYDGTVLDLYNADTTRGNRYKSWKSNGNQAQRFEVCEGEHGLIISSAIQGDERQVLDHDEGKSELCNYAFHGGQNQHWRIVDLCNDIDNRKVRIQSCSNGKYLKNSGIGSTIKISDGSKKGKDIWIPVQISC